MSKTSVLVIALGGAAVAASAALFFSFGAKPAYVAKVGNFQECAAAGYPVMESYPEQCRTPDGRTFVRQIPASSSPEALAAAAAVRVQAAREYSVMENEVIIVEINAMDWPNSCLGVSRPAESCLQVITPGFEVKTDIRGEEAVYHTNLAGSAVRKAE